MAQSKRGYASDGVRAPGLTPQSINYQLKVSSADRAKQLKSVGEEIFRPRLVQKSEVSLLTLGGFGQVGRSCMLLTTPDSKVLIDCGVNPGARTPSEAYPRLDWANISLDAVSYTHLTLPTILLV